MRGWRGAARHGAHRLRCPRGKPGAAALPGTTAIRSPDTALSTCDGQTATLNRLLAQCVSPERAEVRVKCFSGANLIAHEGGSDCGQTAFVLAAAIDQCVLAPAVLCQPPPLPAPPPPAAAAVRARTAPTAAHRHPDAAPVTHLRVRARLCG